ncbi:MAG: MFS transporter [Desulfobacterales bacterium]|nr:MFS transporter [Desulfobacterales bacterium]
MENRTEKAEPKPGKRGAVFILVFLSHAMNHVQSGVLHIFYPIYRQEFDVGYLGLGFLSTMNQLVASLLQISYGFLARFIGRGVLLGVGNIIVGLGGIGIGFARSYAQLVTWVALRSIGASAQHPVGAATLASFFLDQRAKVLGFHQSAGNVGGWIAPVAGSALLLIGVSWRKIIWLIAIANTLMGLAYFCFRDLVVPAKARAGKAGGKGGRAMAGLAEYRAVMRNRNILFLTLAMLAGAAGRGTNILGTYLTTYLVDAYGLDASRAGFFYSAMMVGGIIGPGVVGWLADRISHKFICQFTLAASAVFNFTVIYYPRADWLLAAHLILAGVFIWARGPLIETLFTEATDESSLDTLLSIYYTVAFVSGPGWTLITGLIIDRFGTTPAFALMAVSYLLGMVFLAFVRFGTPAPDRQ